MLYEITVKPGSSKGPLVEFNPENSSLITVYLHNKAIDGAANKELIEVLSKTLKTPKSKIEITKGHRFRRKLVEISF